jgi:hypothetical protein
MLLIQNEGVAPVEAYTLLGYSTARGTDAIGQFGTGAKHGICVLLRAGIDVKVYCGKTRLIFSTIDDEVDGRSVKRVAVQVGQRKPRPLDWVLDFGAIDWTEVRMALREFVSNAIDQAEGGHIKIAMVENVRAKDGFTQVVIEETDEIRHFYANLSQHFLHFGGDPTASIIPKDEISPCRIYRCGVFIRELGNSLCDYNFTTHQIEIDECRNLTDYAAKAAIARLYRNTKSREDLARVFRAMIDGTTDVIENNLDSFYLTPYATDEEEKEVWKEAWFRAAGDAIPCPEDQIDKGNFAIKKGYRVVKQPSEIWGKALKAFGVTGLDNVLDGSENLGRSVTSPTEAAKAAVTKVWEWLDAVGMTQGKPQPTVKGFDSIMNGEQDTFGYVLPGGSVVHLRNDIEGPMLLETALEEVVHYITGSVDGSRDIQDFTFRFITRWLA